jgi:hypothetical protein
LYLRVGLFRREPKPDVLAAALATFAGALTAGFSALMESQAKSSDAITKFYSAVADNASRSAARTLGIRSGAARRARKSAALSAQAPRKCRLCTTGADTTGLTIAEIEEHRKHQSIVTTSDTENASPEAPEREELGN